MLRFRFLEAVREYALERFEQEEEPNGTACKEDIRGVEIKVLSRWLCAGQVSLTGILF